MFKKRITNDEDLTWEVRANDSHKHKQKKSFMCFRWGQHADNVVRSYKYTFLTFVPLSLYEQFQRLANLYYLFLLLIQSIPVISAVPWFVAIIPLLAVLSVRGLKDLLNDLARRRSDKQINTRKCDILSTKTRSFHTAKWKDVSLGDVLRIHKDEVIPADILLLCSSEAHSLCYVETADIDGETNLKYHQALTATHEELTTQPSEKSLAAFNGVVICEPPNSRLYNFRGELQWGGQSLSLDTGHILLRGTTLRNTETIYGLAIYLGADSKIFKNGGKLRLKRTQVEQILNRTVIGIVIMILSSALLMAIGSGWFESNVSSKIESLSSMWVRNDPIFTGFLNFFSYIMLLSAAMPIALYITFDIIHVIHSKFIGWDVEMRVQPTVPAQARNTSLNEELGQVGHLLSDKTGTLTQNRLLFRQCCIAGEIYGDGCISAENVKPMDLSWNTYSCGGMAFSAPTLVDCLRKNECHLTREFFNGLALCHTVMAEWKKGAPVYQSASPDEEALVGAARELGFVFLSRTRESLTISEMGITKEYQLLALLDFTSQRRRMSVLVRDPEGGLKLYSKGADLVILERLQMDDPHRESTDKFLELFAQVCLRTLCVAVRSVPEALWGKWSKTLTSCANMVTSDREKTLEALYDDMEKDLQLLGVTAIEDRLQEGVPETIELLRQAGIKIWVLTGDKKETAVNIGYSCKLLDPDTRLLEGQELRQILQSSDPGVSLSKTRQTEMWSVDRETAAEKTALVLTGEQLMDFHRQPEWGASFMQLAEQCQSVVCCRVTPLQKADIVTLVRKHTKSVTMAIGDGANDVNMIKTAHIGVGLVGVEGGQAVQNADFSLAQFRFLQRLLLVHGRWSYRRISFFLRYFLYKTTCFALVHIWYGLYSGYSAQTMYEFWYIPLYTSFYTSYPILSVAIFDQDVGVEESLKWPSLYHAGQRYEHFNFKIMAATLLYAGYTSLVLFFVPYGVWQDFGRDYQTMAFTVAMGAFFATNTEVMLFIRHWTGWNVAAVGISILLFFIGTIITQSTRMFQRSPREYFFIGVSSESFIDPVMWLTVLLTACVAVLPSIITIAVMTITRSRHKVHSQQKQQVELKSKAFKRGGRHRRSTYAMSQSGGMGRIITSGTSLRTAVEGQETEGKDKRQTGTLQETGGAPPSYDKQNAQPILSEL